MSSEVRSQIEAANREFMAAFARQDAAAVAKLYASGGQLLPPNSDMVSGVDGIREFWKGTMAQGITAVTLETREVEPAGDGAVEVGRYRIMAGDALADQGKYLVVWKKEGGAWRLHRDMWNTSQPATGS